jgi:uncharacterized membrane protein YbjE (DUF340 family)
MKDSLLIVLFFAVGLVLSYFNLIPEILLHQDISTYVLYLLMIVVGINVGSDKDALKVLYKANWKIILVPLTVIVGSISATALFSLLISDLNMQEAMAVGSGFGYYSLSSILISELHGETLGTIALLANVIREIMTLLFAPLLLFAFGKLAPVAAGGATSMDTTLPIITRVSGNEYGIIAIFSGLVLTLLVPVIVTFILSF